MEGSSFEAWRATGRQFAHRGHPIFWQAGGHGGTGATLLLIHGFPTASWDWHLVWPTLSSRFAAVIAPDMIGFGWSKKPREYDYSIFDQADLCEALLRDQGTTSFSILAHDYGDTVAQELLARHEDRRAGGDHSLVIDSVCFLNGGLFPESHRSRLVQKLLLTPLGPLLARAMNERRFEGSFSAIFGPRTKPKKQELGEYWRLVAHEDGQRIAHRLIGYIRERRKHRARWVGVLSKSRVPLLLIDGAADPISGVHMAERYRQLVPDPKVVLLPEIGHYPQVEDPDGVLRAFLDQRRSREPSE